MGLGADLLVRVTNLQKQIIQRILRHHLKLIGVIDRLRLVNHILQRAHSQQRHLRNRILQQLSRDAETREEDLLVALLGEDLRLLQQKVLFPDLLEALLAKLPYFGKELLAEVFA